jgi:hypothetical protein
MSMSKSMSKSMSMSKSRGESVMPGGRERVEEGAGLTVFWGWYDRIS